MIYNNCTVSMGMNFQIEQNEELEENQIKVRS